MKMSKVVKNAMNEKKFEKTGGVVNFMGGNSYTINPLDTLKMVSASSIFGEPQYYRVGEFAEKAGKGLIQDGVFSIHHLVKEHSLLDTRHAGLKTSQLMEKLIDEALDYDFEGTLMWAVELRKDYFMRLNPQVILVRAATHPGRKKFTEGNPGKFQDINLKVMSRGDEPASQLTYWNFRNGDKNKIPSILKRSWAKKVEGLSRYEVAKYKNKGIGLVNTIRVCHAKGELVDELMKTGTIEVSEEQSVWEKLRSEGKSWTEILQTIKLPHMALLRNLRGIFTEVEDLELCKKIAEQLKEGVVKGKQFPFRYYTAMRAIKGSSAHHQSVILDALEECIDIARVALPQLKGKTISLSDNSGSAWGALNSEYGSVTVAEIDNLSGVLTAQNSDEGYVGVFGDRLEIVPISKRNGALSQAEKLRDVGRGIGGGTENGIWLFFDKAIRKKEHWDNIFIYSDQQAGHGGLYGIEPKDYAEFCVGGGGWGSRYIDVVKLINKYRSEVNPKVNVYCVQTAGYDNVLVPEYMYRTNILYGWTGKESLFADIMNKFWDEKDAQNGPK